MDCFVVPPANAPGAFLCLVKNSCAKTCTSCKFGVHLCIIKTKTTWTTCTEKQTPAGETFDFCLK